MTDELKPVRCGCGGKADVLVLYRKGQTNEDKDC